MKLSDLNTEDLKRMKQACIDTRAKYDGYRDHQVPINNTRSDCPLCSFSDEYSSYCEHCPWGVIDRKISKRFTPCYLGRFNTQKAYTRRKRLDRWIKLIDEEIRRRG